MYKILEIEMKFISLVFSSVVLVSGYSAAIAQPFDNPQCEGKPSVLSPGGDSPLSNIDGGFLRDESCSTIYVLPPRTGSTLLTSLVPSTSVGLCPAVWDADAAIEDTIALIRDLAKKAREGGSTSEITTQMGDLATAIESLEAVSESLASRFGVQANLLLTLDWVNLIAEYRRLNENNYATVTGLPVEAGVLTFNKREIEEAAALIIAGNVPVTLEADVPGVRFKGLEDFNIADDQGTNTVIFGNSLAGFVRLSLAGACNFYDEDLGTVSPGATDRNGRSVGESLVANYTYFYRLGSAATYKMTFDAEAVGEIVATEVQRRNGNISAGSFADTVFDIQQSSAINIEIVDPRGVLNSQELRDGFIARVAESFANDLLSKFSEVQSVTEVPPDESGLELTGFREETRKARHCRRKWYGAKTCSDHVYKVKIPASQVKERVRRIIADDFSVRYSEQGKTVTSYIESNTAAITVGVEVQ